MILGSFWEPESTSMFLRVILLSNSADHAWYDAGKSSEGDLNLEVYFRSLLPQDVFKNDKLKERLLGSNELIATRKLSKYFMKSFMPSASRYFLSYFDPSLIPSSPSILGLPRWCHSDLNQKSSTLETGIRTSWKNSFTPR